GVQTFLLTPGAAGKFVVIDTTGPHTHPATLSAPTNVTPTAGADLRVTGVVTQPQNYSGEKTTVQWTVQNVGDAMRQDTHFWTDQVFFSADPTFIPRRAVHLVDAVHSNDQPLGSGQSYSHSEVVTLPEGIGGTFYIYVIIDASGTLSAGNNNDA